MLIGGTIGGALGGAAGVVIGLLGPLGIIRASAHGKLKRRILATLASGDQYQVHNVMSQHGFPVPSDAFPEDNVLAHPFVLELARYRNALTELEHEQKVIWIESSSHVIGYVNRPHQWVNEWAGRVYQKAP